VALVAATASVPAMLTGISTAGALDDWSAGQLAAGRPTAEIVAMVNEHGRWSTAEPDKGLPELLPGLGEDLAEMDLRRDCRITVASAPADPEEIGTIEWPNMSDWTPAIERYSDESNRVGKAAEAENEVVPEADEPYEPPALRYCIRVACASPVAWNAPPSVFLYSSHPGSSPEWMWWMRIDLFAAGRAPEPGGYCTETGALAERYQG
jgi:hypothetical protein